MKKLLLAALLFVTFGAFADEFDDFVAKMQQGSARDGIPLRVDREQRMIFLDFKLPPHNDDWTQKQLDAQKQEIIGNIRKRDKDGKFVAEMKKLKLTFVFNFTSSKGKILRMRISWMDL